MNKKTTRLDEWHYTLFSFFLFLTLAITTTTTQNLAYLFAPYKRKIRVTKKISLCFFPWTQYFPRILAHSLCFAFPAAT